VLVFVLSFRGKKFTARARSLDSADPVLRDAHRKIAETWTQKLFPNF
jgi:hypothetical protein